MISSVSNPRIKSMKALQKSRERRKQGIFQVEGLKEIEKALIAGYAPQTVLYCPDIIEEEKVLKLFSTSVRPITPEIINRKVYGHLAYRERTEGIIASFAIKPTPLNALSLSDKPLLLVVESVEKPGNLGALLRTADAAGLDAVIICDEHTDIYNPNVIRSSLGCLFTVQTAVADSDSTIQWLKSEKIQIFGAALTASKPYHQVNMNQACALVMGTESTGLSDKWLAQSDQNIIIPMHGVADSMNVSTSAAVLVFEAIRQRSS